MKNTRNLILLTLLSFFFFSCEQSSVEQAEPQPKPQPQPVIPLPDVFTQDMCKEISRDSLKKTVEWLENMGSRFALKDDHRQIALAIKNKFIRYGYANAEIDSFYMEVKYAGDFYKTWQYNVVATLEGNKYPDSVCILGAHYDSYCKDSDIFKIAPGANDNASGVAATLEIARVLKAKGFKNQKTIKFVAFAAEELGLFGSSDFAEKQFSKKAKISMMINNDMIANWSQNLTDMCVNINNYANSQDLLKKAQEAAKLYTNLKTNNDNTYNKYSDSYSFYRQGYKALFFISNANDESYHTTADVSAYCNFDFCREVAKLSCAMLMLNNK